MKGINTKKEVAEVIERNEFAEGKMKEGGVGIHSNVGALRCKRYKSKMENKHLSLLYILTKK
ncbi:MAG: hypothetical protein U5K51_03500 [Flavobacteriaceae bacterium]|nr:hypothetical protein [Flavobacteriaceae bacterium]